MFSSLFFLILTVLLINLTPEIRVQPLFNNPWTAMGIGLAFYGLLLLIIYFQNRLLAKPFYRAKWLIVANLEIIGFLIFFLLVLGGDQIFGDWQSLRGLAGLAFYFFALYFFHFTFPGFQGKAKNEALRQLTIIAPFAIPYVLIITLVDAFSWVPESWNNTVVLSASLISIAAMFTFLPALLCQAWGCVPLRNSEEKARLEALCKKAHFKHAGFQEWTVMNQSPTAAIVGVVPSFRYILFTRSLLTLLPASAIDAILAHEIGHSKKKHLILFPVVIIGMFIFAGEAGAIFEGLFQNWEHPMLKPIALFLVYAASLGFYFRFIFGYFSRLFERQADLYGLELGIPLHDMIIALDEVGIVTGNTHQQPSWHHYSLAQRIDFLQKCIADPSNITFHQRKVLISLIIFFILLLSGLVLLFI